MITTKRFDYVDLDRILIHPTVKNHRELAVSKVSHYAKDILSNGLLEPLVVWEKSSGQYFLIGGFHRIHAIYKIREEHPGYFDQVDVRVVNGTVDEMRALNLKLNADRVDTKITDYFETVLYLNNVNWSKERIADFLDRSVSWVDEILRFVPVLPPNILLMLEKGETSWNRAKIACQKLIQAPAGEEEMVAKAAEDSLKKPAAKVAKPLNFRSAKSRLAKLKKEQPKQNYELSGDDIMSLVLVLEGKQFSQADLKRVKSKLPGLL